MATEIKEKNEKQFGSARVPAKPYESFKGFLESKKRSYAWFVRGILLFSKERWQEIYNEIEIAYEEAKTNQ